MTSAPSRLRPQAAEPPPHGRRRATSIARRLALGVALVVAVVVLVVLALAETPWGNERVRRIVVAQANGRLTGRLDIARVRGNLLSGATLTDVRVVDSLRRPVFSAARVEVRYGLWAALHRRIVLKSIVLDTPFVLLDKRPGARWNFQALMRPGARQKDTSASTAPPEIGDVTVHRGQFVYRRPWRPDSTLPADKRDAAIAAALASTARSHTERVDGGFQRVVEYRDIDAHIPELRLVRRGHPGVARVAALSMIAAPYRPPHVDVRSLVATIYFSKDSLWWHGARMRLPASEVTGDGRIGFNRSGFTLRLDAAPVAFADLRWLNPRLPAEGNGRFKYTMRVHGDTAEYAVADADIRYGQATAVGSVALSRIHPATGTSTTLVRGADLTVARLTTAMLHELEPSLKVPRSGMIAGHVVASGSPSALHVNADLQFDDARAGRSRVVARGGLGIGGGVRARDLAVQLRPLRLASLAGTGHSIPLAGAIDGSAIVNGGSREEWQVSGDLTHVDGANRSHVVGEARYRAADRRILADATLRPLSLATVGRFAPAAQLRGSVTGRIHAEGTPRDLRLSGVLRSTDGGVLNGAGSLRLAGAHTRYDVAVATDALDVSRFSRRAPRTRLTGTLSARGHGSTPATADVVVAADFAHSRVDTFSVERLVARLTASNGLLRADSVIVHSPAANARASGTLGLVDGREGEMRVSIAVDSLGAFRHWLGTSDSSRVAAAPARQAERVAAARADSARRADAVRIERLALGLPVDVSLVVDTLPSIRRDSLSGSLALAGRLRGNVKRLSADAHLDARDVVMRGSAARVVSAEISSPNIRDTDRPVAFRADAEALQVNGYAFEKAQATGWWTRHALAVAATLRQDSLVSYAARGELQRPTAGVQRVTIDSLAAHFDTLTWRLTRPARVALDHGSVALDSIELRSNEGGRLFGNGWIAPTGAIRLDVAAENVQVATVLRALQRDAEGEGRLAAAARIAGSRTAPEIASELHLRDARWHGTRAPDVDSHIRYASHALSADVMMRDSTARAVLAGNASLPFDLALEGRSTSRRLPGAVVADVALDTLDLATLPISSRAVADVRGRIAGEAHLRGTWDRPRYSGTVQLGGGGALLTSTGMQISGAVAGLRLVGDTLRLDSLVAQARGTLRASGIVSFADRAAPFVRAAVEGRNVRVLDQTRGLLDVDGELTAVGPLSAVRVTGRAEMLDGFLALKQFRKDLLRVKAPGDLSFFMIYDTTTPPRVVEQRAAALARPHRVGMIADLSLVVDRNNYYRNRPDANTEFHTGPGEEVRAHIDTRTDDAWAVGFVRIGEGVAIFRARSFEPARGSLTFSDYTGGPGYLQQVGERLVWEPGRGMLPLQLLTGGTSKAPAVGLEAGTLFPIRGHELNGYLTIGRDRSSLLQQSGSSLSGSPSWSGQLSGETGALARRQQAATALGVVLHDIGTGATKEFGLDAFSVTPADVPTELVFGKTGGVRGAVVEGGRYVTVDRYVAGEMRFTTAIPGARLAQRFRDVYRLDVVVEPRFLFRMPDDLGITHPTIRTGVFGAFLTRWWDW